MRVQVATDAGTNSAPSEDRALVGPNLVVVLDGQTVRTETGCQHGVAWFVDHLASAIVEYADHTPVESLRTAIEHTAKLHAGTCNLDHPGTPSAAVAVIQVAGDRLRYLVLGDVTVVLDTGEVQIVVDDRVNKTAPAERAAADALPAGSPEKAEALVRMKVAEQAARNRPGGYWIAASAPEAAEHALTGAVPLVDLRRVAVLTDGAARIVETFQRLDWPAMLDVLTIHGPASLIAQVRATEAEDRVGVRWPRNKISDDATAVYCDAFRIG